MSTRKQHLNMFSRLNHLHINYNMCIIKIYQRLNRLATLCCPPYGTEHRRTFHIAARVM